MTTESNPIEPIRYTKKNPFLAKLTCNKKLTGTTSNKDTRHFVVDISGSQMVYTPGDSLAVTARNPPILVQELIDQLGFPADTPIDHKRCGAKSLQAALTEDFILNRALKKIMVAMESMLPEGSDLERLKGLLADGTAMEAYLFTRDYVDILRDFPQVKFETPEAFLDVLGPMLPRLYSIASSQALHPDEVHLLIAVVRYENHNRPRKGLASGWLADHAEMNRNYIPVFPTLSKFRLPEDRSRDIIMVGPGTGVAPFRAFLEQREFDKATGRNWLIFGEQHRKSDFFYEEELVGFQERGVLTRLDTAFSRDQDFKIYVQDKLRENAAELWSWLQNGAYFYVCGDASRMAKDVHEALINVAEKEGKMDRESAEIYIGQTLMKEEKRYLRDVY